MELSWGKRFIRRSVCVPLPTPGAPTRMTRAALARSRIIAEGLVGGVLYRARVD